MASIADDTNQVEDEEIEEEEEEQELDLTDDVVVTKYKTAADICNIALKFVISQCVVGAKVSDICAGGNAVINGKCQQVYKSKKIEKGIAFPTCISVNNCVCHYSPLPNESVTLAAGDIVKIDIGVHVSVDADTEADVDVIGVDKEPMIPKFTPLPASTLMPTFNLGAPFTLILQIQC